MKIIQFITRMDDVGGAQVHVLDLSLSLMRAGHEVIVLSMGCGPVTDELQKKGIRCEELIQLHLKIHPIQDWLALKELCKWLKTLKPDILATHSSKAGMLGRMAGKICRVPTVFTAHGWAFSEGVPERKRRIYTILERVAGKISNGIITVSNYDYQLAIKHRIIHESKLKTIHNSVPDVPEHLRRNPAGSKPKLIMVARFAAPKDQRTLLLALESIQDLSWELDLVGDGPLLKEVKDMVSRSSIAHRVHFLGNRRDIPELLARSHLFVLISRHEGLPISVIEAMRAGLPIVASDVGGMKELIDDGKNGFLIPRNDAETLMQRLKSLIVDPQQMTKMGQCSRTRYESHFLFEHMSDQTIQMYKTVLANGIGMRPVGLPNKSRGV
ncbi:glycosyltransferase family 4 protein [Bacillus sp. NTK074B]|uniref:glycosyltransferase family 4 protein n=1 Tax=Bacillus sp. NTK074B TaxID=2802174 RepID=UPI001A90841B|nr:glycosyltransferase family 4 protein [Bacillus sp. NTK074B]